MSHWTWVNGAHTVWVCFKILDVCRGLCLCLPDGMAEPYGVADAPPDRHSCWTAHGHQCRPSPATKSPIRMRPWPTRGAPRTHVPRSSSLGAVQPSKSRGGAFSTGTGTFPRFLTPTKAMAGPGQFHFAHAALRPFAASLLLAWVCPRSFRPEAGRLTKSSSLRPSAQEERGRKKEGRHIFSRGMLAK